MRGDACPLLLLPRHFWRGNQLAPSGRTVREVFKTKAFMPTESSGRARSERYVCHAQVDAAFERDILAKARLEPIKVSINGGAYGRVAAARWQPVQDMFVPA